MTRVLVIGAGIAGLSAAWRLRQAGLEATIVEAEAAPGGRMADLQQGEIAYNSGARLIYPFGRAMFSLMDALGLRGALVKVRNLSAACRVAGREYRLELMPGLRTLATPGLTQGDRVRLAAFAARLAALRFTVDPDDLLSAASFDDESLASYADRVLGPRLRARLLDPLFRGTRSWDTSEISAAFLLSTLPHMLGRSTVYALAGGMGRLTRELASRLAPRTGARAVRVERSGDGVCRTVFADGSIVKSDRVLLAVPGAAALALLADPEPEEARFFAGLRYNSLGVVHYAVDGDVPPSMRFLDAEEGGRLATFQTLPAAPQAGRVRAQLYCQLTPEASRAAAVEGWTGALDAHVRNDVRRLFPGLDVRLRGVAEQWIPHKLPLPYPGYIAQLARFRAWQNAAPRRVYFCGDYMRQALVTGACASGIATAARIARTGAA
jgi:oxygen-dependent protoporphyrinogen oxidase